MIEFRILGPLVVVGDGQPRPIPTTMSRRLLGILLANADEPVPIDVLIEELWNGGPPRTARESMQVHVWRLRRALGGHGDRVTTHQGGYGIHVDTSEIDSRRFERRLAAVPSPRNTDISPARIAIRDALDLWRGPAYDGMLDMPSVAAEAERLTQLRLAAIEDVVQLDLDAGLSTAVAAELSPLILKHPYRERMRGQHMLALYQCGRQAEALEAYRETYALLDRDLGVQPTPELQELHQRMLAGDPTLAPAMTDVVIAPVSRPKLLPRQVVHFTGRRQQLDALDAIAADASVVSPVSVLSAVTGAAGMGKTALVVHWGHGAVGRFPDAQLYINLQGYGSGEPLSPLGALSQLLQALGVAREQVPVDEQTAIARYRAILADRQALVILDNASSAAQVRPLLAVGPRCMSIVTSRDRLAGLVAMDGARRVAVDVLSHADATQLLASIVGAERVAAEPEPSARLVELCGGLPLALRIAAAALAEDPARSIADHVAVYESKDRLPLLAIDGDPESSVRTVLAYSYRRLDQAAQRMFRLLGVAPGSDIEVGAAAALGDLPVYATAAQLDQLAAAHLIEEHAPARYRFHDLIHDYARELAAAEDAPAVRDAALDRVLSWYVANADHAADQLRTWAPPASWVDPNVITTAFDGPDEALRWFDVEGPTMESVIRDIETVRPDRTWQLVCVLFQWHHRKGVIREWVEVATIGVRAAVAVGDLDGESRARASLAVGLHQAGRLADAIIQSACVVDNRRIQGTAAGLLTALRNLGGQLAQNMQLDEALECLTEALALIAQHPDLERFRMSVLINIGYAYGQNGKSIEAIEYERQAIVAAEATEDRVAVALTYGNLGAHLRDAGCYDEARVILQKAVRLAIEIDHRYFQREAFVGLGRLELATGHLEAARDYLRQAEDLNDEDGYQQIEKLRERVEMATALKTVHRNGPDPDSRQARR